MVLAYSFGQIGERPHKDATKIIDNSNQTFVMYGAHHGQKETTMMEITYSRRQ